jgi:hypothetical protein
VVDGASTTVLHRSQIGALLGLQVPDEGEATELARDCAGLLDAWTSHLEELPFDLLLAPTPSRDRSLRNLTVNVFHPFELLPGARSSGRFEWDPDGDAARELELPDAEAVTAYTRHIALGWHAFATRDHGEGDPQIDTPRGSITWANLLAQQRWHAAYHYRQLTAFLAARGRPPQHPLRLDALRGLDLPDEVF